jgi:hypothetical protein
MNDDIEILNAAWGPPEAPSHAAYTDARAALLARAQPRTYWRLPAAAAALAAAVVVLVAQNLGDTPRAVPTASAQVLERAAVAAEQRPFTPPRDNQWIYTADAFSGSDGKPMVRRVWHQAKGFGLAFEVRGKVKTIDPPRPRANGREPEPFDSYKTLAALPTDPDALLRWAYRQAENVTGAGLTEDGDVYAIFRGALGGNVLPPKLEAGIFRALKRVPGVSVATTDVLGHHVTALALTEGGLRQELLLDPGTYAYRGQRSVTVRDIVVSPEKAGNATGEIKKGHTVIAIRLKTAIVDKPGETSTSARG